jgi:hypothetical protein
MRHKLAKRNVVEVIAEGVRSGLTLEAAAALAGVHRSTLHRWRTAPPGGPDGEKLRELQEAVAQAQAANLSALVNVAQGLALSGDGNMIRFLLERRHGWRPEAAVELRGDRALGVKAEAEAQGLDQIFIAAGFEWRDAGCSMCLAMNPDKLQGDQISASSSNRNFKGRQGSSTGRTLLMSPAMVVAAAVMS